VTTLTGGVAIARELTSLYFSDRASEFRISVGRRVHSSGGTTAKQICTRSGKTANERKFSPAAATRSSTQIPIECTRLLHKHQILLQRLIDAVEKERKPNAM
jgi:hypothetical protein